MTSPGSLPSHLTLSRRNPLFVHRVFRILSVLWPDAHLPPGATLHLDAASGAAGPGEKGVKGAMGRRGTAVTGRSVTLRQGDGGQDLAPGGFAANAGRIMIRPYEARR